MTRAQPSADAIEQEAARWLIRREEADWTDGDQAALDAWLDTSLQHQASFWRLEHGWAQADRVVALGTTPAPSAHRPRWRHQLAGRLRAPAILPRAAAGGIVVALALAGSGWWWLSQPIEQPVAVANYSTPVGGLRTLRLGDGSKVDLNTATRLRAVITPKGREAWLEQGEAFFDVVHQPDRQFIVHAGSRTIAVLGTRFSVRRDGNKVTVAVLSGRVRIDNEQPATGSPRTAFVSGGDVAIAGERATLVASAGAANVADMTAWRDHVIVFENRPLSEAAMEFSRYTERPIRVEDPSLAAVRIGGTFRTGDSESFVELLQKAYGVRVRRTADATILER